MGYYAEEVCKSFPVGWLFIRSPWGLDAPLANLCVCVCEEARRREKQRDKKHVYFPLHLKDLKKLTICIFTTFPTRRSTIKSVRTLILKVTNQWHKSQWVKNTDCGCPGAREFTTVNFLPSFLSCTDTDLLAGWWHCWRVNWKLQTTKAGTTGR